MSALVNYIISWWVSPEENQEGIRADDKIPGSLQNKHPLSLISSSDLMKVKLSPPERNIPSFKTININALDQSHLHEIMNVKLNPTIKKEKSSTNEPQHLIKRVIEKYQK